jgi:hypothetical protein
MKTDLKGSRVDPIKFDQGDRRAVALERFRDFYVWLLP